MLLGNAHNRRFVKFARAGALTPRVNARGAEREPDRDHVAVAGDDAARQRPRHGHGRHAIEHQRGGDLERARVAGRVSGGDASS
jgi:hypothetical protein